MPALVGGFGKKSLSEYKIQSTLAPCRCGLSSTLPPALLGWRTSSQPAVGGSFKTSAPTRPNVSSPYVEACGVGGGSVRSPLVGNRKQKKNYYKGCSWRIASWIIKSSTPLVCAAGR